MKRAAAVVACFLFCSAEQCIPGPFRYEGGADFVDDPVEGEGESNECSRDDDCAVFSPDSRCEEQSEGRRCTRLCGLIDGNGCDNGLRCAFDPKNRNPFSNGTCGTTAAGAAGVGAACVPEFDGENPCSGAAYCLPTGGGVGRCVRGCQQPDDCGAGSRCEPPLLGGGGTPACMPACDLDSGDCSAVGASFVCAPSSLSGLGCTPDNGVCQRAGCDVDQECNEACSDDFCTAGTFCVSETFDNCRIGAPDAVVATCRPPAREQQHCVVDEPDSCASGFACVPVGFGVVAVCVQQAAAPIADGGDCDPDTFNSNSCAKGSYCAFGENLSEGTCQRFCRSSAECVNPGEQCVNGNLRYARSAPPEIGLVADIKVCALGCVDDASCAPSTLSCDADSGQTCGTGGFCLPRELGPGCTIDGDCSDGFVCGELGTCVDPRDRCE